MDGTRREILRGVYPEPEERFFASLRMTESEGLIMTGAGKETNQPPEH